MCYVNTEHRLLFIKLTKYTGNIVRKNKYVKYTSQITIYTQIKSQEPPKHILTHETLCFFGYRAYSISWCWTDSN